MRLFARRETAPDHTRAAAEQLRWAVYGLLGAAVLFIFHALYWARPFDDAYIALRYADNLAAGHGLVFNPGERVEGYTSPLWVALLGGLRAVGLPLPATAAVLGVLGGVATLLLSWAIGRRALPGRPALQLVAPWLLAAHPVLACWAATGMETTAFVLAVTAALWAHVATPQRAWLTGLLCAVAALLRPEGLALLAALGACRLLESGRLRALALHTLGFVALFGPAFAWRYHYYGWPLPNTYYAKVTHGVAALRHGLAECAAFFTATGWWLVLAVMVWLLVIRWREAWVRAAAAIVLATVAAVAAVGPDAFPGYRFLAPLLPAGALLLQQGLALALRALTARWRRLWPARALVIALALLFGGYAITAFFSRRSDWENLPARAVVQKIRGAERITREYLRVGRFLRDSYPASTTMAINAAGAVPFISRLRTIDMLGLTDAHIAHRPIQVGRGWVGHEKHDAAYVLSRAPDLIFLGLPKLLRGPPTRDAALASLWRQSRFLRGDRDLLRSAAFQRDYTLLVVPIGGGSVVYFQRKGQPLPPRLRPAPAAAGASPASASPASAASASPVSR